MFSGGKKGCIGNEWVNRLCGNKSCKSIYKCKSKNCKPKSNFVSRDKLVSTSSKRIFDCVIPNETTYIDCNSPSVIYLMTCNRCSLPYVAGTYQKVSKNLTGKELDLTNLINMFSVAFYQIISTKVSVATLLIQSKYKKN